MMAFIKKYNIALQLLVLILTLSSISIYNLFTQRGLLLQQMKLDSVAVLKSISAGISRFHDIKATMSLEKLVNDISLDLEIFEFRFISPDGKVRNSMFEEEIGQQFARESFKRAMQDANNMDKFYFEERDFVPVMAITHAVEVKGAIVGYIDLSVDVSEYNYVKGQQPSFAVTRRQADLRNLLSAISGSIRNSVEIERSVDINRFLKSFVGSTQNLRQISIIDPHGVVVMSSNPELLGNKLPDVHLDKDEGELLHVNGELTYRLVTSSGKLFEDEGNLMIALDAAPYAANERLLIITAVGTSLLTIAMAIFITISIYRYNMEQAKQENRRLEEMVKERTQEIERLSNTDGLTGLWNRRHLEETLAQEFMRAKRYGHDFSIMILDLDHFKKVNDTYGHLGGDAVLREASNRVKAALRHTDFVARYGGEEIVVILTETPIDNAPIVGEKLRAAIADGPVEFEDKQIPISTSIGISAMCEKDEDYHSILERADSGLYKSKEAGRNRVTLITCDDV